MKQQSVPENDQHFVTKLLAMVSEGDAGARERLFDAIYSELHREAMRCMKRQPASHTLQSTALVHEAYLKLFAREGGRWENRRHFLDVAAKAMRSILVDHVRRKNTKKRSATGERVLVEELAERYKDRGIDLVELDDALNQLAGEDARAAKVVELRYFGQLTMTDIAGVLGVPKRTVERDWTFARIWLGRRLR